MAVTSRRSGKAQLRSGAPTAHRASHRTEADDHLQPTIIFVQVEASAYSREGVQLSSSHLG